MPDTYLSQKFAADLDRLGAKATRKVTSAHLDALEAALLDVADGESPVVLDSDARAYVRILHERAQPSTSGVAGGARAPDFEEVVQGSTWLADPIAVGTDHRHLGRAFDTRGDVPVAGLLCLGEWKSGEMWVLDVAITHGYVYLVTERREVLPMFRCIGEFAQWAVANELWKRRLAKDGETPERLGAIRWFKTVSFLREAGLVPQAFRPKRWKPKRPTPTALGGADKGESAG